MDTGLAERFSLAGRIAFVTGASSGIGRHIALTLAGAGADIVVAARRAERLADVAQEIGETGRRALAVSLDVTSRASVEAAFAQALAEIGTPDILVNNAGVAATEPFLEMSEESWTRVIETDLTGVWRVGQVGARAMVKSGAGGSIINVASVLGLAAQRDQANYTTAKAGVIHLTKNMALELGRVGIRVNAVAPGYFGTEINADFFASEAGRTYLGRLFPKRLGTLDELDGIVLLLASAAGAFINGAVIPVDGGTLLKGV